MTARRHRPVHHPPGLAAGLPIAAATLLGSCGAAAPPASGPPAWRAAHPDPNPDVRFLDASGVCVITVRYPQEAPGEIVVDMSTFVQTDRSARPAVPPSGRLVASSGDWSVIVISPTELRLLTADTLFDYRTATC